MILMILIIFIFIVMIIMRMIIDHESDYPDHHHHHHQVCRVDMDQPAKKIHNFIRGLDSSPGTLANMIIMITMMIMIIVIIMVIIQIKQVLGPTSMGRQQSFSTAGSGMGRLNQVNHQIFGIEIFKLEIRHGKLVLRLWHGKIEQQSLVWEV